MAGFGSAEWFKSIGGTVGEVTTLVKNIGNLISGGASSSGTSTTGSGSTLSKYLPYALIGAALVGMLFIFRKKKA